MIYKGIFWHIEGELYTKKYECDKSGRVEIKGGKAVIYLNPTLNSEEMLAEHTRLFGLDELDFVRVKNDGSRHYRAYAP